MIEDTPSYEELLKTIENLKTENEELKIRLKKYTNPDRRKKYYQNHKAELLEKQKLYNNKNPSYKPTKEQKKEYNKRAYEKRKREKEINNSK